MTVLCNSVCACPLFTHNSGSYCLPLCQGRVGPLFIPAFFSVKGRDSKKSLLIRTRWTFEGIPDPFIKDKQNRVEQEAQGRFYASRFFSSSPFRVT